MTEAYFDKEEAGFVKAFLQNLKLANGEWAGQPFKLLPWQVEAVDRFYGTRVPGEDGKPVRQYQTLYEEIPKKNGKSEFAAGLALYHLLMDGERSPQVYVCAADKENASIIYNASKFMVENDPFLSKVLRVVDSKKEIWWDEGNGLLKVMSSDSTTKHGFNISCLIFDELHAQPNRKLWDVMTFGSGSARRQPVRIVLTTAGNDPDYQSIGWEVHARAVSILRARGKQFWWDKYAMPEEPGAEKPACLTGDGAEDDPTWLPLVYGFPDDPDVAAKINIYDETAWAAVNPSLGLTVKLGTLRQEARDARKSDASERLFRWLRLNQWVSTKSVGWVPLTIYDKTQWNGDIEALAGKRCYGGVDLSSTTDLTAFVLLFPPQAGLDCWVAMAWGWRPEEGIAAAENRDHVPYRDWMRAGFIRIQPGDVIDYEDVIATITGAAEVYDLKMVGFDPYISRTITQRLAEWEPEGESCTEAIIPVEIPQRTTTMSPAMKEMERLIRTHEMKHVHNTALRWCFGNVRCYVDGNENIKPMKNLSTGRIDMVVAWIIAMATALADGGDKRDLADAIEEGDFTF